MAEMVRVDERTHARLKWLAEQRSQSMSAVLASAVQRYEEQLFWEQCNAAYARLRQDPLAWAEEQAERAAFDGTLLDGLENDPYPATADGDPLSR